MKLDHNYVAVSAGKQPVYLIASLSKDECKSQREAGGVVEVSSPDNVKRQCSRMQGVLSSYLPEHSPGGGRHVMVV